MAGLSPEILEIKTRKFEIRIQHKILHGIGWFCQNSYKKVKSRLDLQSVQKVILWAGSGSAYFFSNFYIKVNQFDPLYIRDEKTIKNPG